MQKKSALISLGITLLRRFLAILVFMLPGFYVYGQESEKPVIACVSAQQDLKVDGWLDEEAWQKADSITSLTMVEPVENGIPTYPTVVKILVTSKNIYLGFICYDDQPEEAVAFSKARDSELENEDYLKVILDTYKDGRNGYIFAINPFGARYDALVSFNGESGRTEFISPHHFRAWL